MNENRTLNVRLLGALGVTVVSVPLFKRQSDKGVERKEERKQEGFHLLVYSSNAPWCQGWDWLKSEALELLPGLLVTGSDSSLGANTCCFSSWINWLHHHASAYNCYLSTLIL